jgi:hypothetical protein
MFSRPVAALACALLLLLVRNPSAAQDTAAPAQDTQIMDWVFAMPEGWRVANSRLADQTTRLLALEHTERSQGALTQVTFGRPGTFEGTFRKWFDGHWKQLNKDYAFADPEEPTETEMLNGYKAVAGAGVAKMDNGNTRIVMLIGLNKGTTAGVMCFLTEDLEFFEANTARMDSLLASASFASLRGKDEPAPKLKTNINPDWTPSFTWEKKAEWPKGDAPLEGLWGLQSTMADRWYTWGWSYRVAYLYLLFFKDGTVFTRMPSEGLLCLDVASLKLEHPLSFGSYTVKGDLVTVTTGSAESPTVNTYTRSGDDLTKGTIAYTRIKDDAPDLAGRYMKLGWDGYASQWRKGITFGADGTFDDEGFNSMLGLRWWCAENYWLLEHEPEPGKGKWRAEKNTLELIYEDGRKRRFGFHMHQDETDKATRYPVLNSYFMTKVK